MPEFKALILEGYLGNLPRVERALLNAMQTGQEETEFFREIKSEYVTLINFKNYIDSVERSDSYLERFEKLGDSNDQG